MGFGVEVIHSKINQLKSQRRRSPSLFKALRCRMGGASWGEGKRVEFEMIVFYLQRGYFSNRLTTASSFAGCQFGRGRLADQRCRRPVHLACRQHRSRRRLDRRSSRVGQAATSRCPRGQPGYSEAWRLGAHCWLLLDFRGRQFGPSWQSLGHCCRTYLAGWSAHTAKSAAVARAGRSACQHRRPG